MKLLLLDKLPYLDGIEPENNKSAVSRRKESYE